MRKVALLCVAAERDMTIERLRELGVLHIDVEPGAPASEVEAARKQLERAQQALAALPPNRAARASRTDGASAVESWHRVIGARREADQTLERLESERRELAPFGSFDPASAGVLAERGLCAKLYRFPARGEAPAIPEGGIFQRLSAGNDGVAGIWIGPAGSALAAKEIPWPARSLAAVEAELESARAEKDTLVRELSELGSARADISARVVALEDELHLREACAAMGADERCAWITGFCPAGAVPSLEIAAASHGWAISVREPAPGEIVPTQLMSPRWVRQIHGVLRSIGITPGYGEPDVSPVFLVALVLFAAMLIGDAGYGALIVLLALLVRWKKPHADSQMLRLLFTIGGATMAWGAITGTWFAIPSLPAWLDAPRIEWLAGSDKLATARNIMWLCFFLGAVHLTVAHLWAALRAGKSLAALAQLGWIATTWTMFFVAQTMVLGAPFPKAVEALAYAGVALIVLFMTPVRQLKDEWFNHVMLPLSLVSNFVDVVSYLRLFAVGTAGVAVASAFNDMAARVAESGGAGWLLAALIAIFGHSLNLLLCAMGVLVHGVRLNTLEFSAHLGMQWTGVPYAPLKRREPAPPLNEPVTVGSLHRGG